MGALSSRPCGAAEAARASTAPHLAPGTSSTSSIQEQALTWYRGRPARGRCPRWAALPIAAAPPWGAALGSCPGPPPSQSGWGAAMGGSASSGAVDANSWSRLGSAGMRRCTASVCSRAERQTESAVDPRACVAWVQHHQLPPPSLRSWPCSLPSSQPPHLLLDLPQSTAPHAGHRPPRVRQQPADQLALLRRQATGGPRRAQRRQRLHVL